MLRSAIVPVISMVLLSVAGYHVAHNSKAKPPLEAPAPPARSPWGTSIAGSGVVEPCTENIAIGTHVTGVVQDVLVVVGQNVKKGAPLFRIDATTRSFSTDTDVTATLAAAGPTSRTSSCQPTGNRADMS